MTHAAFAVTLPRDVVRVSGPDATEYLQGQLSQDVAAIDPGKAEWSLLLEPDGKLGYWLRVSRLGGDEFVLDVDAGSGDGLRARLERFKLRVDAAIEPLDWMCVAIRGDGDAPVTEIEADGASVVLVLPVEWPGLAGVDLLGPDPHAPAGVAQVGPDIYEAARIAAGWPKMGAELTEGRIPAEAGIVETSVSFTKGCYTGQELVARIDSRGGNVPRHLRHVVVPAGVVPPAGADVLVEGEPVGEITSAAQVLDHVLALAYIKRSVEPPVDGAVRWDGGEVAARVEPLHA